MYRSSNGEFIAAVAFLLIVFYGFGDDLKRIGADQNHHQEHRE